jgi:hypothetical protein
MAAHAARKSKSLVARSYGRDAMVYLKLAVEANHQDEVDTCLRMAEGKLIAAAQLGGE